MNKYYFSDMLIAVTRFGNYLLDFPLELDFDIKVLTEDIGVNGNELKDIYFKNLPEEYGIYMVDGYYWMIESNPYAGEPCDVEMGYVIESCKNVYDIKKNGEYPFENCCGYCKYFKESEDIVNIGKCINKIRVEHIKNLRETIMVGFDWRKCEYYEESEKSPYYRYKR